MKVKDIIKVNVGTILQNMYGEKFVVLYRNQDCYNLDKSSLVLWSLNKEFSKAYSLYKNEFIICGKVPRADILKYKLLGKLVEDTLDWNEYLLDINELEESLCVIISYKDNNEPSCIIREGNSFYLYDMCENCLVSKRKYKGDNLVLGIKDSIDKEGLLDLKKEKRVLNKGIDFYTYYKSIQKMCDLVNSLNTPLDLYLIKLYTMGERELKYIITRSIFRRITILEDYEFEGKFEKGGSISLSTSLVIKHPFDFKYNQVLKEYESIIDNVYKYIRDNLNINSRKKLSTVVKELEQKGLVIKGYDRNISKEEFFDTDNYMPYSIIDPLLVYEKQFKFKAIVERGNNFGR